MSEARTNLRQFRRDYPHETIVEILNGYQMVPSEKKAWQKALRKGDRLQGQRALCERNILNTQKYYCCLGVKGEIDGLLVWEDGVYFAGTRETDATGDPEYLNTSYLPETVLPMHVQQLFSTMNDLYDFTFRQIANFIEVYL